MILQLNYDTTRIALAINHWPTGRRVSDWRNLYLVILPGQEDDCTCCHTGGSPWYLRGCWLGKPTGVDIANPPRPDFPPFFIQAHEYDDNGRIVFVLPERWRQIAYGRYTGKVIYMEPQDASAVMAMLPPVPKLPTAMRKYPTPLLYNHSDCSPPPCEPIPCVPPPPPACTLAKFDIDYGYKCSEHIIKDAALALSLAVCEEDV